MPFEDGVMYMPARGAEVRCTLWALCALRAAQQPQLDTQRVIRWFREIQNPDGGFGYWHGRASDILATVSVLESLQLLNVPLDEIDCDHVAQFLQSCSTEIGIKYSPEGDMTLSTTCQGMRGFLLLCMSNEAEKYIPIIAAHASRIGDYAAQPGGIPDLLSTYQAILTHQALGVHWELDTVRRFLNKVRQSTGWYSWTPLSHQDAGPLATCLGMLLDRAVIARQSQTPVELLPLNL
jgi:prenyltransferase beta subunit